MNRYEIRTGEGHDRKAMGDVSGVGKRYYVWNVDTNFKMVGFTRAACRDGGFKTKKAAAEFIVLLTDPK